jgi:hypothetical protein
LIELSDPGVDQLIDHKFSCPFGLVANGNYSMEVSETGVNGERRQGSIGFEAAAETGSLNVLDEQFSSRSELEGLFSNYVESGLVDRFGFSSLLEEILLALIIDLANSEWDNLADPDVQYDVILQRVEYGSVEPDGKFTNALTGLVAFPDIDGIDLFEPRDEIILLGHATGSTPSDMSDTDAWFIVASLLAGQGYLVVAPDNFGRGGTAAFPETYLQSNRTAVNSIDLLNAVVDSGDYVSIADDVQPVPLHIIGYSQGGHTAIASWLEIVRHFSDRYETRRVYSGGAPFDLYKTVRGVLQHIDGVCEGDGYCDLVDSETTIPFATRRILPGLLEYTNSGLVREDVIIDDDFVPELVTGFLTHDPIYDDLKALLQLSTYTNIINTDVAFNDGLVSVNLYHSEFDRLVPVNNTLDFFDSLQGNVRATYHQEMCNSTSFRFLFEATEKVGVIHSLCGLNVLDEIYYQLR